MIAFNDRFLAHVKKVTTGIQHSEADSCSETYAACSLPASPDEEANLLRTLGDGLGRHGFRLIAIRHVISQLRVFSKG